LLEAIVAALRANGIAVQWPSAEHEKFDPNSLNKLVE
jgi:hypothetical protein